MCVAVVVSLGICRMRMFSWTWSYTRNKIFRSQRWRCIATHRSPSSRSHPPSSLPSEPPREPVEIPAPHVFSALSFPPNLRPCSRVARWRSLLEGRSSRKPRRPRAEFSAQLLASHQSARYIFQDSASAVRGVCLEQPGLRLCLHRLRPWRWKTWPAGSFAKEEFYFTESSEQKGFWCWSLRSDTSRNGQVCRLGAQTQKCWCLNSVDTLKISKEGS